MDTISLQRIETVHPLLRLELKWIYNEICSAIQTQYSIFRISQALRTIDEQNKLYAQGRTTKGKIVTNAKGGDSFHNYGLAVDIVQLIDKDRNGTFETASWSIELDADMDGNPDWLEVVEIFEKYGWQWGLFNSKGERYDHPHFQKTFGYSIKTLKELKKDKFGYPIIDLTKRFV